MNIYIYGAGYYGKQLALRIENIYSQYHINAFIDATVKKVNDYKVINPSELSCLNGNIPVVIAIADLNAASEISRFLYNNGTREVYYYLRKQFTTVGNDLFENECIKIPNDNNWIFYLETHLSDGCNLNCRGCSHFSPLFNNMFLDEEKSIEDIQYINSLSSGIGIFNMMGGEPFLYKGVEEYIATVRHLLPNTVLMITTNGLLVPQLNDTVLSKLREYRIIISISEYEPTSKILDRIVATLEKNHIEYGIRKNELKKRFYMPLRDKKTSDGISCLSPGCINIRDGKISRCPTLMYISKFNEVFEEKYPMEGIMNIRDLHSGGEINRAMNKKVPLCDYCCNRSITWERCGLNVKKDDFVYSE